jgi:hypothetical protein
MIGLPEDCEPLDALGGQCLRVRFSGQLQGQALTWDATLIALAAHQRESAVAGGGASDPARRPLRAFLEVGPPGTDGRRLTVGLPVPAIDAPTLRKAVIMVRQYRALRPGRYEFGPVYAGAGESEP